MPVTYTNRKGNIYFLCQTRTASGKPRYYFATIPKDPPLEELPDGDTITEGVNGRVSLKRVQALSIRPEELRMVQAGLQRDRRGDNYRARTNGREIDIYERTSPDPEALIEYLKGDALMGLRLRLDRKMDDQMREVLDRHARFEPILRFVLLDSAKRIFGVERRLDSGKSDKWITLNPTSTLDELVRSSSPSSAATSSLTSFNGLNHAG